MHTQKVIKIIKLSQIRVFAENVICLHLNNRYRPKNTEKLLSFN